MINISGQPDENRQTQSTNKFNVITNRGGAVTAYVGREPNGGERATVIQPHVKRPVANESSRAVAWWVHSHWVAWVAMISLF